MGTGKTFMTISVIRRVVPNGGKVLILCPDKVVPVWFGEFRKHAPDEFTFLALTDKYSSDRKGELIREAMWHQSAIGKSVVIAVNYESAIRPSVQNELIKQWWTMVVCDESHRIKGHKTATSKMAWHVGKRADRRLALTGTAMPQGPQDIFAQYRFLDDRIFGKFWTHFTKQYAVFNKYIPNKIDEWQNKGDMNEKIQRIRYHIPKDVLVLPDRQEFIVECPLSPAGMRAYKEMEKHDIADISKLMEGGDVETKTAVGSNAAVSFLRLVQLAQGYVKTTDGEEIDTDTAKRKALLDLLEQIDEPVVVYGWFKHDLRCVEDCAKILGRRYGEVSGSRKDLTDTGKMREEDDVLGVQAKSGGVGIDLTRSRYQIIVNTGLISPGDYDQLMARQYRPGQTRNVVCYTLVSPKTVDVKIARARQQKRDVVQDLLSSVRSGKIQYDEADEVF